MRSVFRPLIVIALTGCSGPSGGTGASSPDGACTDWATGYCAGLNTCSPSTLQSEYGTAAECTARNKPICLGALSAAGTGATPATVEACSRRYGPDSCYDIIIGKPPAGCVVAGFLGTGKPCGDGSQCAGAGGYCKVGGGQTCGTCATLGEIGQNCDSDRDCAYGLVCGLTCQMPVTVGSPCDGTSHFCPPSAACADKKCVALVGLGAACDPQANLCDGDLGQCDAKTLVCTAYAAAAAVGTSCTSPGTSCVNGACGAQGTCVAYASDGSSCDDSKGQYCSYPAVCVSGVCVPPDASQCH